MVRELEVRQILQVNEVHQEVISGPQLTRMESKRANKSQNVILVLILVLVLDVSVTSLGGGRGLFSVSQIPRTLGHLVVHTAPLSLILTLTRKELPKEEDNLAERLSEVIREESVEDGIHTGVHVGEDVAYDLCHHLRPAIGVVLS